MKENALSFFCGILFAFGLGVSGMTQPGRVTAFLDFFGAWDPSLLFVMVGAILVYFIGYRLVTKRSKPLLSEAFHLPKRSEVDRPLVLGSALFGTGWGLAGFCPGPALTSMISLHREPLIFSGSMLAGMLLFAIRKSRGKMTLFGITIGMILV